MTLPPTTLEQEKQYSLFEAAAMNVSGSNQCESEPYLMIRSGEELSPSSSQYGLASDADAHGDTRVMSPNASDSIF